MTCYRHLPFQFPHRSKINTFIFIHQTLHFLHLQTTQFRSKDKWVYKKHLLSTKQLIVKRWLFLAPRYRIPIRFNSSAPRLTKPQAPPEPLWPHLCSWGPQRGVLWLVDSHRVHGKPQPPLLQTNNPEHTGSRAKRRHAGTAECTCQSPRE